MDDPCLRINAFSLHFNAPSFWWWLSQLGYPGPFWTINARKHRK
jgi:hypothetical protein